MKKGIIVLFLGLLYSAGIRAAGMSGNYTIDSTKATGGQNFKNWTDFRNTLVTDGMIQAVTINVVTGMTLTSQITFTQIKGAAPSQKIRINGNGRHIQMDIADALIVLNGADHFIFDSLVVRNTSSSSLALGIRLTSSADYNIITRCTIEFSNLTLKSPGNGAYIAFAASAASIVTPGPNHHGAFNLISLNRMRTTNLNSPGPAFGIIMVGHNTVYSGTIQNNTVKANTISNFYHAGVFMQYTNGNFVIMNNISRTDSDTNNCYSTVYGIYSERAGATDRPNRIDSNTIHSLPFKSAMASSGPLKLYGIYTKALVGTKIYRTSVSSNHLTGLRASGVLYLGYNADNDFFDLIGNVANDNDLPVTTSDLVNFFGFSNMNISSSYRYNGNIIQYCDGGYNWFGIWNSLPKAAVEMQEINDNIIQFNSKTYSVSFFINSTYAQFSDNNHKIDIKRNIIRKNTGASNGIYCMDYGTYNIHDNVIDSNFSGSAGTMTGIFAGRFGNYSIKGNQIINNRMAGTSVMKFYGIYAGNSYNTEIYSNLLTGNTGYSQTHGVYLGAPSIGTYKINIWQNTVVIDGNLSGNANQNIYPFDLTADSSDLSFKGNLVDVQNVSSLYMVLNSQRNLFCDHNTFYSANLSLGQLWKSKLGNALSDTGFFRINNGSQNFRSQRGHHFDAKWASRVFMNQNNVPSSSANLTDVYGTSRSVTHSDRGAVEYNGVTSVDEPGSTILSLLYPNPATRHSHITLVNKGNASSYRLLDISGMELQTGSIEKGINTIDISYLLPGVYMLLPDADEPPLKLIVTN